MLLYKKKNIRYLMIKKWMLILGVVVYLVVVAVVVILLLVFYGHKSGSLGKDCKCPNGTPTATCANSNDPSCDTCDEGYHKNEYNACEPNQCTCTHGPHAIGPPDCLKDQATFCTSCESGYWLDNDTNDCQVCCKCDHGIPTKTCKYSNSCDNRYIEKCDKCNQGYHQVTNNNISSCELNKCTCTNSDGVIVGTPANGTQCTKNGDNICSKCNDGYNMQTDNTCKLICDVEHGETWTNWPTKPGNPYGCALCPHHYYVSTTHKLPGNPPTLDDVAKDPSRYQYMCSSYDKLLKSKLGKPFEILTSVVEANNAEYVDGENNQDANGWNGNYCGKGMCYGKTTAEWEYCLYPCYSQKPNS